MLKPEVLTFLSDLKENNNKEWFDANRKRYDAAKANFLLLVGDLISRISTFDKALTGLESKSCVFRINRDVRFSANKDPYKTAMGAYFTKGGKNSFNAGYYLHLEPGDKTFVAGGMWMPEAPKLKAIRQEIVYNSKAFHDIIENPAFLKHFKNLEGEKLKTAPKDYPKDHPEIELLKHKSFIVSAKMKEADVTKAGFSEQVATLFSAIKPLNDFLNTAVE